MQIDADVCFDGTLYLGLGCKLVVGRIYWVQEDGLAKSCSTGYWHLRKACQQMEAGSARKSPGRGQC